MPRQKGSGWSPDKATPAQDMALRAIDAAKRAARQSDENLWKAIEEAWNLEGQDKIPAEYIAQRAGVVRATLYRRLSDYAEGEQPDIDPGKDAS